MQATNQLLIRVLVGKVKDRDRLLTTLRNVPIVENDPSWNCVIWVKEALLAVQKDGKSTGTAVLDWHKVRDTVLSYCQEKKDGHRFDGKIQFDMSKPATYNMLTQKEIIP